MRWRIGVLTTVLLSMTLGFATRAHAATEAADRQDTESALDVKRVYHEVDAKEVKFGVETYAAFDNVKDFWLLRWDFDMNGDGNPREGCMLLEQVNELPGDKRLRAVLYPKCGAEAWSTNDATKPAGNVVELTFPMRDLVNGMGFKPDSPVSYRLTMTDKRGQKDIAPDAGLVRLMGLSPVPTEPPVRQVFSVGPPSGEALSGGQPLNELALSGPQASAAPHNDDNGPANAVEKKAGVPMGIVIGALAAGFLLGAGVVVASRRKHVPGGETPVPVSVDAPDRLAETSAAAASTYPAPSITRPPQRSSVDPEADSDGGDSDWFDRPAAREGDADGSTRSSSDVGRSDLRVHDPDT